MADRQTYVTNTRGGPKAAGVSAEEGAEERTADAVAREKYDPSARSKAMSSEQVNAQGGLGAYAANLAKKKDAETRAKKLAAIK